MMASMRTAPTTAPTTMAQILTCLFVPGSCTVLTVDEGSASTPLSHHDEGDQQMADMHFVVFVSWHTGLLNTA